MTISHSGLLFWVTLYILLPNARTVTLKDKIDALMTCQLLLTNK